MYDIFAALPLTEKVCILIILLIIAFTVFSHVRYNNVDFDYGPIVLTMLGIFGCFLGIAIGLLDFDTKNIQESVPNLLAGVKTSFWASIFGILGALTIKVRYQTIGGPRL